MARWITVKVLRPRKSNFTSPALSTHFMLNWVAGRLERGSRVERREFRQRAVGDDHAGGVGRGVAVETLELKGDLQHLSDVLVVAFGLLQARFYLDRLGQGHRRGWVVGDHLGQAIDLAEGKLHHPANVAQHRASLEAAEGDDLGHAVVAVAPLDVGDHLLPPLLAEVDVEIGHRDPLRVEKALEDQAEPDRVDAGDKKRPGYQGSRAGTSSRTDGDVVGHGPTS